MRSLYVFIHKSNKVEVEEYLKLLTHNNYRNEFDYWIESLNEMDSEDMLGSFWERFNNVDPSVIVLSNVFSPVSNTSPRIIDFLTDLLTRFEGVAFDGLTSHAWDLSELREGKLVQGHPFFDRNGWYEQRVREKGSWFSE